MLMSKMASGDFFYYTLLKHGKILIGIAGLIIAILVFVYTQHFGVGFEETRNNSMKYCEEDMDCFEHCGECVSVKNAKICTPNESIKCACINNTCAIA